MSDNQYYDNGEEEAAEANDRINRILGGGGAPDASPNVGSGGDPLGGDDPLAQRQFRSRTARSAYEDDQSAERPAGRAPRQPAASGRRAIAIIGGVLVIGLLAVAAIVVVGGLTQGGSVNLPFFPTATPTATMTPTATLTPTPTKIAPNLQLPQLTCIFTSEGCLNYCKLPANAAECQGAKDFIKAQGANADVWFECIAPESGQVGGEPKKCLEDAWRAQNP